VSALEPEPPTESTPKVAVVTGARGLGQATAGRLAERGYDVAIANVIESNETASAVRSAGGRALPVVCDVSVPSDVASTIKAVEDESRRCDVLVNSAGTYPLRPFKDLDLELWRRILDANVTSAFLFCKAVVAGLTERGFGRIINLTSNTVSLPVEGVTHYITSRVAIIGFTRALGPKSAGTASPSTASRRERLRRKVCWLATRLRLPASSACSCSRTGSIGRRSSGSLVRPISQTQSRGSRQMRRRSFPRRRWWSTVDWSGCNLDRSTRR